MARNKHLSQLRPYEDEEQEEEEPKSKNKLLQVIQHTLR